ncbi:MAG TPA: DUF167 domain-containing protein [Pseudonocardiaceae bacterium]|jgi:hypothetical protein|nr:DUF167 domain-containing protein [Pseudonocardiaceae bacterium]
MPMAGGLISLTRPVRSWWIRVAEYRFAVRVKPGAAKQAVGGSYPGPRGAALIVAVTASAIAGKANEALREALAAALKIRRADIDIVVGGHGRDKIIAVEVSPDRLDMIIERVALLRDK